jgi:membrane dipeptidase
MQDANSLRIFDGHNDTLLHLYGGERGANVTFFDRSDKGHIDLPRAREGGLAGGFFAVFLPNPTSDVQPSTSLVDRPLPEPLEHAYALRLAMGLSALLFRIEAESQGQVKVVRTAAELEHCLREGIFAAIFHMEGAEAIDTNLDSLEVFYQAGLRSLGPVWSRPNAFAHGVPFRFPSTPDTGPGLTDAGKELVKECNRLGILIDLSHLNEQGFWDIAKLSQAPLVATHSNAHAICPSTRNLTDKQLDAIRDSDGMVGVNFHVGFLNPEGERDANLPLSVMVQHIDYLVNRIGIDRVGLGSDFDGALMPAELGDVTGLPKLIAALQAAGYDDAALRKITHENWVRVLRKTWGA